MSDKPKILYVDDESINLELFSLNMSDKYEVVTAINGLKGLHTVHEHNDIIAVVSDMRMPLMNGLDFIYESYKKYPNIAYYMASGYDITPEIKRAMDDGIIKQYFRKPFQMNEIDKSIKTFVKT